MTQHTPEHDTTLTPPEAAAYLGVKEDEFKRLVQRFGVGRYYQAEEGEQWVYDRGDLDRLRDAVAAESEGREAPATDEGGSD